MGAVSLGVRASPSSAFSFSLPGQPGSSAVDQAVKDALASRFGPTDQSPDKGDVVDTKQEAKSFAFDFSFDVYIPGSHYSGMSNQDMLLLLAAQGRDFAQDTQALRKNVRDVLIDAFTLEPWDDDTASQIASDTIRDWIVKRIEEGGLDIDLTPLSPQYLKRKAADGYDTRIGIRKYRWIKAVEKADVSISF